MLKASLLEDGYKVAVAEDDGNTYILCGVWSLVNHKVVAEEIGA